MKKGKAMQAAVEDPASLEEREAADTRLFLIGQDMRRSGCYEKYAELVNNGESPQMASCIASRTFAATRGTDTEFVRRELDRMNSMEETTRNQIVQIAQSAGIKTHGKSYNGQLGRYNDPAAWVSDTSDVRRVAKAKGLQVRGMVNVDAPDVDPAPRQKMIAPDIKQRIMNQYRTADPKLDEKCRKSVKAVKELEHRVIEKHARPPRT